MFSSNSESNNKNRRKSFFLFGSGQATPKALASTPSSSNNHNKVSNIPSEKQNPFRASSSKLPRNNKNPFIPEHNVEGPAKCRDRPLPESPDPEPSHPVTVNRQPEYIPILVHAPSSTSKRTISSLRRRPPPPIDIEAIETFRNTPPLQVAGNEKDLSSAEGTLKSPSFSPSGTPVALSGDLAASQHRRQRSEAEKLVEDLDGYIKEHRELSQSPHKNQEVNDISSDKSRISVAQDLESNIASESSTSEKSSIDLDSPLESPYMYVGPLVLANDNLNRVSTDDRPLTCKKKSDAMPDFDADNDRFSFTTSLNDKSVKSIQQVAVYDSTGAAPVITNYSYEYKTVGCDDNNDEYDSSENEGPSYQFSRREYTDNEIPTSFKEDQLLYTDQREEQNEVQNISARSEQSARRKFRVVNEDRPSFYLNAADSKTISNTTTTTEGEDEDEEENAEEDDREEEYVDADEKLSASLDTGPLEPKSQKNEFSSSAAFSDLAGSILRSSASEDVVLETRNMALLQERSNFVQQEPNGSTDRSHIVDNLAVSSHPSLKSNESTNTSNSTSPKPDKMVRLVSSYVEELRLKYYTTSNFLQAPPNLPISLKQKNNLIQPKNIKVRIRTSSKQIGIKHGGAKQKLLTLETTKEEENGNDSVKFVGSRSKINVDHTKEFHNLLNKGGINKQLNLSPSQELQGEDDDITYSNSPGDGANGDYYLDDIPGDDAYDSDDAMAPLRETRESQISRRVSRSNTVVSYFTKNQQRLRSGTLENSYAYLQGLPNDISIEDYRNEDLSGRVARSDSVGSDTSNMLDPVYSYGNALHVANPDTDSE